MALGVANRHAGSTEVNCISTLLNVKLKVVSARQAGGIVKTDGNYEEAKSGRRAESKSTALFSRLPPLRHTRYK